jgi:hypothetical protein
MFMQPALQRRIWDSYPNSEPLRVYEAEPSTAGQLVYQQLKVEPRVSTLLAARGEPDTIQVLGARLAPKRFILLYTRPDFRPPYRIVIDPSEDGLIARAPEPFPSPSPLPAPTSEAPRRQGKTHENPVPAPMRTCIPTAEQGLNCPIDRTRNDCRSLCSCRPPFEWCH